MNLQFAPDWPVRCEFKFIMSLLSFGPRQSAIGVDESRFRADGAKACNNMGTDGNSGHGQTWAYCRMSLRRMSLCRMSLCRMSVCRMPLCRMSLCRMPLCQTPLCQFLVMPRAQTCYRIRIP